MAAKYLEFNTEARSRLKRSVDQLAEAVKVTLGPKGRNVVIEKKFGNPTVTPSLVIVGFPNFFSMTTLRPLGPRVTFTASASWSTPRLRRERASVLNSRYLAVICFLSRSAELGDDVGFLDQDDLFLVQLDLRAGVLPIDDAVADLQLHRDPLALRSEEHTSELQSLRHLVCRLLLEKK